MNSRERKNRMRDAEERRMGRIRILTEHLAALRESLGLTQSELATLVGVTRSQIVNYETGRRVMSWMAFLAFIQVLGRDSETKRTLYRLNICDRELEHSLVWNEDLEAVRGGVTISAFGGQPMSDETLLQLIENELRRRSSPNL